MNVKNIRKTQEALLRFLFTRHYNMHHFIDTSFCGTTLCLAGIAAVLATEDPALEPLPSNLDGNFIQKADLAFDGEADYESLGDRIYNQALSAFEINDDNDLQKPAIFYLDSWPQALRDLYRLQRFHIDSDFLTPQLIQFIEGSISTHTHLYGHPLDHNPPLGPGSRYIHNSFWKILAGYLALECFIKCGDSWAETAAHWSMGDFLRDNPDAVARFISAAKNQLTAN
jgi:hypothetical protein